MGRAARALGAVGALGALGALVAAVALAGPAAGETERVAAPAATGKRTVPLHRLQPLARQRWPRSFAGLWQKRGTIYIAFTERAKRRVKRLRRRSRQAHRLRAVRVERSLKELEATQRQMIDDRESRPPGLIDLPPYNLDIDVTRNAPVVTLETVVPDFVAPFKQRYGEQVIVRQGPLAEFDACLSRVNCTPYLRAGLRVLAKNPDAALLPCSTAFAVQQRSAIYRGILSAAHCGEPDFDEGGIRYHGGGSAPSAYGVVDRDRMKGRTDAEVHEITNPSFSRRPWIYDTTQVKARPVQRVSYWSWIRPGMGMCKAGITTGKTCGKVQSRYFSPCCTIPDAELFIRTTYCAEGGDSGGGVYYPNKLGTGETKVTAYGIHSGGAKDYQCNEDNSIKPGDYSFFGHIQFAQTLLGVRVQLTQ